VADQELWTALGIESDSDFGAAPLPWFEPGGDPMDELDRTRLWLAELVELVASVSCVDDVEDEPLDSVDDWSLIEPEVLDFLDRCARLDQSMLLGEAPTDAELEELLALGHVMILRVTLVPLAEGHIVLLW
jgi:hypothetical protein